MLYFTDYLENLNENPFKTPFHSCDIYEELYLFQPQSFETISYCIL